MTVEVSLRKRAAAVTFIACVAAVSALLARQILFNFIVFSLSDSRMPISAGALETATQYFPSSPRLSARLAEARVSDPDREVTAAAGEIERATRLSPYDYRFRVVLALARESQGDLAGAETSMRDAVSLAPSNIDVRWRLANLLLRENKIGAALVEFRSAISRDQSLMPVTLDLLWRLTGEDLGSLQSVVPANPQASLSLAGFLLKQGRTQEAVSIFEKIDHRALAGPGSSDFIDVLISKGELGLAKRLWVGLVAGEPTVASTGDLPTVWNAGFEMDQISGLGQFDWRIGESSYAAIGIAAGTARGGSRSLRIDFSGRDTTRLDGEISQRVVLVAGKRYRLEYFVKTQGLVTTEGPRVTLRCDRDPAWTPAGAAIAAGNADWAKMQFDFVAPRQLATAPLVNAQGNLPRPPSSQETVAVTVTVVRTPRFSYDEPMRGTISLDDFRISAID